MIEQVDRFLAHLLRDRTPLAGEEVTFDAPDDGYRARHTSGQTVNLFLYDIRENHDLRANDWTLESRAEGGFVRTPPKTRVDLLYLVTAWDAEVAEPDILAEHALLSRVLRTLLAYPTLPEGLLPGPPLGLGLPLPTLVIQPESIRSPADLWSALRQPPRPAIYLVVTVPVPPAPDPDAQRTLIPVASRQLGMAQSGGLGYRLTVRPALALAFSAGSPVRRTTVQAGPVARLQQPVFATRDELRVSRAERLAPFDWALLDEDAASEFVLVGELGGSGEQTVPLLRPLRAPHTANAPLRRLLTPENDRVVGRLAAPVDVDATTLALEEADALAGLDADAVLLLSDGARSEPVRAGGPPNAAGDLPLSLGPRGAHPAGSLLYLRTPDALPAAPANRCVLVEPASQSGNAVTLDTATAGQDGEASLLVMVGAGARVEFGRLTVGPAGTPLAFEPPLRHSHPAGTAVRAVTPGEQVGTLHHGAATEADDLLLMVSALDAATARRTGRPLLAPGEVIAVEQDADAVLLQVTGLFEEAGLPGAGPELLFAIGGRALDDADPAAPISAARVSLAQNGASEPLLNATTDPDGRFRFANLPAGTYRLRASAVGHADADRQVVIPATRADEYQITLSR